MHLFLRLLLGLCDLYYLIPAFFAVDDVIFHLVHLFEHCVCVVHEFLNCEPPAALALHLECPFCYFHLLFGFGVVVSVFLSAALHFIPLLFLSFLDDKVLPSAFSDSAHLVIFQLALCLCDALVVAGGLCRRRSAVVADCDNFTGFHIFASCFVGPLWVVPFSLLSEYKISAFSAYMQFYLVNLC